MNERGNVLFLILIAVALFAALSYAVTSSTRGGGKNNASSEKADLSAARVMNYGASVQTAIMRLRARGCSADQISFNGTPTIDGNKVDTNAYVNPNSPTNKTCHLFDPAGGGVAAQIPPDKSEIYADIWHVAYVSFTGQTEVYGQGTTGNRPASNDLIMLVPITKAMCQSIVKKLGIPIFDDSSASSYNFTGFEGSYASSGASVPFGNNIPNGGAFCFLTGGTNGTSSGYYYLQTLIAR